MANYVLLHYGFEEPTPEVIEAWTDWFTSVSDRLVDHGSPIAAARVSGPNQKTSPLAAAASAILRPTCRAADTASATDAALSGAVSPVDKVKLFSNPTRLCPPSAAAVNAHTPSRRPKAHMAQRSCGSAEARNGSRSRGSGKSSV